MAGTRRSSRLQSAATLRDVGGDSKPPVLHTEPTVVVPNASLSASSASSASSALASAAPPAKRKPATSRGAAKKKKVASKPNTATTAQSASSVGRLPFLPPEILNMVLENIKDQSTMSSFGRTSKAFYSIIMPRLYRRIAVAAMFHAHIPKLIRTLEPLLTIAQKKQLKKEGKYKGQRETYPTGLNEKAKPICADHVRQLVVGVGDPGRKHRYIVDRYIEEAFKTLDNLEIIETQILTTSIVQSIANLENLQALNLLGQCLNQDTEVTRPLYHIKGIKHLGIEIHGWNQYSSKPNITQALIRNSASTLRSLLLSTDWTSINFFDAKFKTGSLTTPYRLTMLRSLHLLAIELDEERIESILEAVDFVKLEDLAFGNLHGESANLFEHLTTIMDTASQTDSPPGLRSLSLKLSDGVGVRSRFLSSFDTLTKLSLPDYGQYEQSITRNPGLSDIILEAILRHRNLRTLEISYSGITSGYKVPYLSAQTILAIVNGLPELREFEFAPDEEVMDEIGRVLVHARNLTSVSCFSHTSWRSPERPGFGIVESIVQAFLDHADTSQIGKDFIWEDHYRLNRVSVASSVWEIASKFGKGTKGMLKPEKLVGRFQDRQVWIRDVTGCAPIWLHVGYDPEFSWVNRVARDLASY